MKEHEKLEKKISKVEEVEAFAKQRQNDYRNAHLALENESNTLGMTLGS